MKEVKENLLALEKFNIRRNAQMIYYQESIAIEGEEDYIVDTTKSKTISRQQLYEEIWEISVSGFAKKYNIPYSQVKKACLDSNIPVPTNVYWGNISVGKHVEKESLPQSDILNITFPFISKKPQTKSKTITPKPIIDTSTPEITQIPQETPKIDSVKNNQKHNIYEREILYNEVWSQPVTTVAQRYGVSDVAIHKICKSMNIPTPSPGYWAKLKAGKEVTKTSLPTTTSETVKTGTRTNSNSVTTLLVEPQLSFLSKDDRERILISSQKICIDILASSLHPKLKAHQAQLKQYLKNHDNDKPTSRYNNYYSYKNNDPEPFLYDNIAHDSFPRVYKILDALFRYIESLGGSVNDDLSLNIRDEIVTYQITETQQKVPHPLTGSEKKELEKYEKYQLNHSNPWAAKPQIRKWDYLFNGKLSFKIRDNKFFRDTNTTAIELRLGEILIELFEESEKVRLNRIAREEAACKAEEEEKSKELRRQKYNQEVEKTNALKNQAEDFNTACKIRAFISAVENQENINDATLDWIKWAKAKADWFDPTIATVDKYLGKREHKRDEKEKILKNIYGWY